MLSKYSMPMVCLMLVSQSFLLAETRQWTSSDGKFKVEADLVAYDGQVAELKKVDGKTIKVPISKLSAVDREFLKPFMGLTAPASPALAGQFPASVMKFQEAMDAMREIESIRLEGRIAELKKQLRFGANEAKHPIAQEAKFLTRKLTRRLELVKSGKPFVPRISPKDFSVGQIGEFDDDLLFGSQGAEKDGAMGIGVLFDTIQYKEKMPIPILGWRHSTVSRPDRFLLHADFAAKLPAMMLDFKRTSPTDRLLRLHVYEIVASQPRGAASDYVLAQFNMDEVSMWLKDPSKLPKNPVVSPDGDVKQRRSPRADQNESNLIWDLEPGISKPESPSIASDGRIEGETLYVQSCDAGNAFMQDMASFGRDQWSGGQQLLWIDAKPNDQLKLEFDLNVSGDYELGIVFTTAPDFAIVALKLNDVMIAEGIDLYRPNTVGSTGKLELGTHALKAGRQQLVIEIKGANEASEKRHGIGFDYLELTPTRVERAVVEKEASNADTSATDLVPRNP